MALRRAIPTLPVAKVAQTAVDQFGTPAAGAERQIVLFHQRHPQAARRGIQSDADAGDAAADDEDVERLAVGECRQVGGAARGVECGRVGHQDRYPFSE